MFIDTIYSGYAITKDGKVYNTRKQKFLSLFLVNGYYAINIRGKHRFVHRLVIETLVPNSDKTLEVDHIDRNKLNNNIENLRWVTKSENGKNKDILFFGNTKKLTQIEIDEILSSMKTITYLAKLFKVDRATIRRIKINKGYKK